MQGCGEYRKIKVHVSSEITQVKLGKILSYFILTFSGIISSIKLLQRYVPHNIRTSIKHESFLSKFLKSKKT